MRLWERRATAVLRSGSCSKRLATLSSGATTAGGDPGALARAATPPTVMLVCGVNGVGKTTAVAKLAQRLLRSGRSVLLAAADTFGAGAALLLKIWADRLGVPCVTGTSDPAAVAFEARRFAQRLVRQ